MAIASPADAAFSEEKQTICDAAGNAVSEVTIEPIVVTSVTVNPATADIYKGENGTFTADVVGINDPVKTVIWTVEGQNSASTTISESGVLSIGNDETATSLIVKATSTMDNEKSGTATVNVLTRQEILEPQTGDNSNMVLWITVLLVSGCLVFAFGAIEKRRQSM